ncbi:MAG: 5'/3'-nucleotidase SurE [Anaerolineales bacterium]
MEKPHILLTNDDGIRSPGLWAAAGALAALGYVTVAAPRDQSSGMGRSLPSTSDGRIQPQVLRVGGQDWTVYAIGGSPAQAVLHAVLEIAPRRPDLVVSGINYGENVGLGITASGTVGAALEAAGLGIPALAVSLETGVEHHLSYSSEVDFSAAAHFTALFAAAILENGLPAGVDLLKVDVPRLATPQTAWQITRLSRQPYYEATPPPRRPWGAPGRVGYRQAARLDCEPDSDVYILRVRHQVAVTPLTLDLTAAVDFAVLADHLRSN